MLVSEYIVQFFIEKGIKNIFGYPGGMVTYLMDALDKRSTEITSTLMYHEQGAAFAACGSAQATNKVGVAFATSGPGATNLITGIANAYFDSIPTIFITGQVNTNEAKGNLPIRQKGFQEMEVVSLTKGISKYSAYVDDATDIKYQLEKALYHATHGRPGPVVLDIPIDIQRTQVDEMTLKSFTAHYNKYIDYERIIKEISSLINQAQKPCILIGEGINIAGVKEEFLSFANKIRIPVVSSMLAVDVKPHHDLHFGFIGAYGHRFANFIVNKSDLILCLGSRLDVRQTSSNRDMFAPKAKIVRIDIDELEFENTIKENHVNYYADLKQLMPKLSSKEHFLEKNFTDWLEICNQIKEQLVNYDNQPANDWIKEISTAIPTNTVITTDVGQNQVWVAQSFQVKQEQKILFSGGHAAMGYSLPAAIGVATATNQPTYAFTGDGGLQMNIQELEVLRRDKLPVAIILLNNSSLGMIRHFQEMYFDSNYVQTKSEKGYTTPNFAAIAKAYDIEYHVFSDFEDRNNLKDLLINVKEPIFIEILLDEDTYVLPKLAMKKPNHDQDPLLDRDLFDSLNNL